MSIIIGSARYDEKGNIVGGKSGDQTGKEVSTQNFYVHNKGWYILRPKSIEHANKIAERMKAACDNDNIGYNQNERLGITKHGTYTNTKTNCDCSSLVRQCIKEATGIDPGNFTTSNEVSVILKTGLFEDKKSYSSGFELFDGDVLVTKSKGHTVIVVSGNKRVYTGSIETNINKSIKVEAAKCINKGYSGIYSVKASTLNVRSGAGKDKSVVVIIPKGTRVICYGYYNLDKDGKIWLYVTFTYSGKQYTGFCSSDFLSKN